MVYFFFSSIIDKTLGSYILYIQLGELSLLIKVAIKKECDWGLSGIHREYSPIDLFNC